MPKNLLLQVIPVLNNFRKIKEENYLNSSITVSPDLIVEILNSEINSILLHFQRKNIDLGICLFLLHGHWAIISFS